MPIEHIRNFCVIAHIDHGKSTLSDRLIELTGAVDERVLDDQHLDTLEVEKQRGITVKSQAIRMTTTKDGKKYVLNLIDTPGHVDFGYEVSRSMAACEGALLLVDATQGVEAQTVANANLAIEGGLDLIAVVNKVDIASAMPQEIAQEMEDVFGIDGSKVVRVSAKTGYGVKELLDRIVEEVRPPQGDPRAPLRALVFDYKYDTYKGVVAYVRVVDGKLRSGDKLKLVRSGVDFEALEIGWFGPQLKADTELETGTIGYVATGIRSVVDVSVGDTMTTVAHPTDSPLTGYEARKPTVFTGIYPVDGDDHSDLQDALSKLKINDSSIWYEPESSKALGFGFRCGFLGMLHREVVQERLEREFNLDIIATAPTVKHTVVLKNGTETEVDNPSKLPLPENIKEIREPWVAMTVVVPQKYIGPITELFGGARGEYVSFNYLQGAQTRVVAQYNMPLAEMLVDFHDRLKSVSSGYASMDYRAIEERVANIVKLEILVNHSSVDALTMLINGERAPKFGRDVVASLKETIPRQLFEIPLQAAVGARIIARDNIKALRKNVTAKCYGGDVTRKRKLLEKQAAGKKRMKQVGKVSLPQEAFLSVLGVRRSARD